MPDSAGGDSTSRLTRLFALGANDLRTPLATLSGHARTLAREDLGEPARTYVATIEDSTEQIRHVAELLALVARIEEGRFTPTPERLDSLELVEEAAARFDPGHVVVTGTGAPVEVERKATIDSVAALARATMRHGGLDEVTVVVDGSRLAFSPVGPNAEPVVSGDEVREFGASVALIVLAALGATVELAETTLVVELPQELR